MNTMSESPLVQAIAEKLYSPEDAATPNCRQIAATLVAVINQEMTLNGLDLQSSVDTSSIGKKYCRALAQSVYGNTEAAARFGLELAQHRKQIMQSVESGIAVYKERGIFDAAHPEVAATKMMRSSTPSQTTPQSNFEQTR